MKHSVSHQTAHSGGQGGHIKMGNRWMSSKMIQGHLKQSTYNNAHWVEINSERTSFFSIKAFLWAYSYIFLLKVITSLWNVFKKFHKWPGYFSDNLLITIIYSYLPDLNVNALKCHTASCVCWNWVCDPKHYCQSFPVLSKNNEAFLHWNQLKNLLR